MRHCRYPARMTCDVPCWSCLTPEQCRSSWGLSDDFESADHFVRTIKITCKRIGHSRAPQRLPAFRQLAKPTDHRLSDLHQKSYRSTNSQSNFELVSPLNVAFDAFFETYHHFTTILSAHSSILLERLEATPIRFCRTRSFSAHSSLSSIIAVFVPYDMYCGIEACSVPRYRSNQAPPLDPCAFGSSRAPELRCCARTRTGPRP